jgi:hypothetical protein
MVKFFIEFLYAVKIYFRTNFARIHTRMPDIPVLHIKREHAHPADKWGVDGILLPALPVERGIGSVPGGELQIETHRPVQARVAVHIRRACISPGSRPSLKKSEPEVSKSIRTRCIHQVHRRAVQLDGCRVDQQLQLLEAGRAGNRGRNARLRD